MVVLYHFFIAFNDLRNGEKLYRGMRKNNQILIFEKIKL